MERINYQIDYEAMRDHLVLGEFVEELKTAITKEELMKAKFFSRRTGFPMKHGKNIKECHVPLVYLVSLASEDPNTKWH